MTTRRRKVEAGRLFTIWLSPKPEVKNLAGSWQTLTEIKSLASINILSNNIVLLKANFYHCFI
jgi:hypothetical protein